MLQQIVHKLKFGNSPSTVFIFQDQQARNQISQLSATTLRNENPSGVGTFFIDTIQNGLSCSATYSYSHAEGYETKTAKRYSHAEGKLTEANGQYSHAQGNDSVTFGRGSHAEGKATSAVIQYSHAEGQNSISNGRSSHAEGNGTSTNSQFSHAQGYKSITSGIYSHTEGYYTETLEKSSHAEGEYTKAGGIGSHAEGYDTRAVGDYSHSEGYETVSFYQYQHVAGKYNDITDAAYIIGGGTSNSNRKNIFTVDWNGGVNALGIISGSGFYNTITNKRIDGDYLSAINPSGQGGFSIDIIDMGSGNQFDDAGSKIYPYYMSQNIVVGNNNLMYPQNFTVDYTEKNIIIGDDNSVGWEGVNEYLVIGNHNRLKDTQSSLVPGKLIIGNYHFIDSTLTSAQIIAGNYSNPWVKLNDLGLTSDVQEIIGAGTSNRDKKNIFIRDWDGNTWQAGNFTTSGIISTTNLIYSGIDLSGEMESKTPKINPSISGLMDAKYVGAIDFGSNNILSTSLGTYHSNYYNHGCIIAGNNNLGYVLGADEEHSAAAQKSIVIGNNNILVDDGQMGNFSPLTSINNTISIGSNNKLADAQTRIAASGDYDYLQVAFNNSLIIGSNITINSNGTVWGIEDDENLPKFVLGDGHDFKVNHLIQSVQGKYFDDSALLSGVDYQLVVGNGVSGIPSNIYTRDYNGNIWTAGNISATIFYDTTTGKQLNDIYLPKNDPTGTGTLTIDQLKIGERCKVTALYSNAEGYITEVKGTHSHAEGHHTITYGNYSHAQGTYTETSGLYSHAEGNRTKTYTKFSHAEGNGTIAGEDGSDKGGQHAEGYLTKAIGQYSHAEGLGTIAKYDYQHVAGQYNKTVKAAYVIGGGTSDSDRKNIFTVDWDGNTTAAGAIAGSSIIINGHDVNTTLGLVQLDSNGKILSSLYDKGEGAIYTAGSGLTLNNNKFSVDSTIALKSEIPSAVSQLTNDVPYLTTTCSPIPASIIESSTKTQEICDKLMNTLSPEAGMMFMGTVHLQDVPLDLERSDWSTTRKQCQLLIKVLGDKIYQLQLTSTGYGQRSWISMYNGNNLSTSRMQYGDARCPWFTKLLAPLSGYNESTAHERVLYKQYRGATEKYVDDSIIKVSGDYLSATNPSGYGTFYINGINAGLNCYSTDESFVNGNACSGIGNYSHVQGYKSQSNGQYSHADGYHATTYGKASHAEGNYTKTYEEASHAEGNYTEASGQYAHAEGNYTKAYGNYSHAEGSNTQALYKGVHTEGKDTSGTAQYSHAEGLGTIAKYDYQHVAGKYNEITKGAYVIGGGSSDSDRKNIFIVDWDGNVQANGNVTASGITIRNFEDNSLLVYKNGKISPLTKPTAPSVLVFDGTNYSWVPYSSCDE